MIAKHLFLGRRFDLADDNPKWPFLNTDGLAGLFAGFCCANYRPLIYLIVNSGAHGLEKPGDTFTTFLSSSQIILSILLFLTGLRRYPALHKSSLLSLSLAGFLLCSAAWSVDTTATIPGGI